VLLFIPKVCTAFKIDQAYKSIQEGLREATKEWLG
jgi:hypothetical protein